MIHLNAKNKVGCFVVIVLLYMLSGCSDQESLFQRMDPEKTGVTFSNTIIENDSLNILNYVSMYNGGGVGVADFNNDGLQDLYLTGLLVDNKLYLNQGNFEFRDVTDEANAAASGTWSSGVSLVDINNDGLMDIYICASADENIAGGTSHMYVNQGLNKDQVPVFKDMAEEYNLAFSKHVTMAAFFDYDNDGDLDQYVMLNQFNRNNSFNRNTYGGFSQRQGETRDRLFENVGSDSLGHPWFKEVSLQAGIKEEGFGLGVNIVDINKDGWDDIFVSNDFHTKDLFYINNGDGTFTNKAYDIFKHTAYASMGNDVADLNNDGYPEIVVADMRPETSYRKKKALEPSNYNVYRRSKRQGFDKQVVRNVLQVYQGNHLQTGEPLYSEISNFAGIAETDWSWAPLLVDVDNDGWRDLIITNGFPKGMNDNDFEIMLENYPQFVSKQELRNRIPTIKLSNYVFRNRGETSGGSAGLTFEDMTSHWGMDTPSYSFGAAQADLNNDGALDLIVNNINDPAFIYRNRLPELRPEQNHYLRVKLKGTSPNTLGLGATVEIEYADGKTQFHEHTLYRGYQSSVEPVVHFGLGDSLMIDKLTVTWPDSSVQVLNEVTPNQVISLHQQHASVASTEQSSREKRSTLFSNANDELEINYTHEELDYNDYNVQPLLPHKLSQYGPGLSVGDVNSDGRTDIYISGSHQHKGRFFLQQKDGTFSSRDLLVGDNPSYPEEELGSLFFDADGDGDDDLYIVSGSYEHSPGDPAYQDRLFINEDGSLQLREEALPSFLSSGSAVRAADYDRDGDLDLFVAGRVKPYQYPEPVESYLLENVSEQGNVQFQIVNDETAPQLNNLGMVSDALWTDFDNDGWTDLILAGEWMPLTVLKNESGTFTDITNQTGLAEHKGWWNSLCGGDFDSDGDTDYIAGNLGTNTNFQASDQYPVKVYANDFDGNGVYDMIPAVYSKNQQGYKEEVPFHGRENLVRQIPSIEKEFPTSHAYASASMGNILARFEASGTLNYFANHLESSYIENRGDDHFVLKPLPDKLQWAPVYGCTVEDINQDGNPDALLVGNDYGMELSTGESDALNGTVLVGDGAADFQVMDFEESGFFVPGDAKALVSYLDVSNNMVVIASQNRDKLKSFKKSMTGNPIPIQGNDAYAFIHFTDGRTQKKEFYYGSGFLSQSERYLLAPEEFEKIEITDFQGNMRVIGER